MKNDTQEQPKQDEGQQPVELLATEKPVEVSAPPEGEARPAEPEGLPEEVSERTRKEFEKLKAHNMEMAKQLAALKSPQPKRESALDMFAPKEQQVLPQVPQVVAGQPQPSVQEFQGFTPDQNGYVDLTVINNTVGTLQRELNELKQKTSKVESKAISAEQKVSEYEHTATTKQVYAQHPALDPYNEKFDDRFNELVRNELIGQMVRGEKQDYLAAAEKAKGFYDPEAAWKARNTPDPKVVAKQQETFQKRDQISSYSPAKAPTGDETDLIRRTARGDRDAIYERLKRSGY